MGARVSHIPSGSKYRSRRLQHSTDTTGKHGPDSGSLKLDEPTRRIGPHFIGMDPEIVRIGPDFVRVDHAFVRIDPDFVGIDPDYTK